MVTEFIDIRPALDLILQNRELRRQLAAFAEASHPDREIRGATNFLKALVRMAEMNADKSKYARR